MLVLSKIAGCSVTASGRGLKYPQEKIPREGLFHNTWLDHHSMILPTQFVHYLAFEKAKILKSGYATKGCKTPLVCLVPTQSLQVLTHIGVHVMFIHPQLGRHRCMPPSQVYLTRPKLGWHSRGLYCPQNQFREVSIWSPIDLVKNEQRCLVSTSILGIE